MNTRERFDNAVLIGDEVVPCSFKDWLALKTGGFEPWRRIAKTTLEDGTYISTVFLGMDHSFGDGPQLWFETMIFGGPHDQFQDRYSTKAEAVIGHERAVQIAKGLIDP